MRREAVLSEPRAPVLEWRWRYITKQRAVLSGQERMADALLGGNDWMSSDYNIVAFVSVRCAPAVY